jgi:succinate dehydrogenase / fumarate reductase, cytochrome b subunit
MLSRPRPLSPFLHYRWQYTNTLSILHRLSGIALTAGFVLLVTGLVALASGASAYSRVVRLAESAVGKLLLLFILAAFGFHLSNGIRHLAWDAGFGFSRTQARRSAWLVLVAAVAIVFGVCAFIRICSSAS